MNDQLKIPCIFMRSGTSKGPYFLKDDLPNDVKTRDKVLLAVMGSPDNRQIDGLGGAEPVTSKIAIISKSEEEGVDVNYQFAQVKIDEPIVDTQPSCGNILVGVGPYSIEKGLVEAQENFTKVVIRDVNTGMKIEELVRTPNKIVAYEGDLRIDGVPNPGSPIDINFLEVIGSKTKKLFPTGNKMDIIDGIECSIVDSAMPMLLFRAKDFDLIGNESHLEINQKQDLIDKMNSIRLKVGKIIGFGDVSKSVIPKMALLSKSETGSIRSRYFMPWQCHSSHAITGTICLATASKSKGAICNDFYSDFSDDGEFAVEHPTGSLKIKVKIKREGEEIVDVVATTTRHARLIMSGEVQIQKSLLK